MLPAESRGGGAVSLHDRRARLALEKFGPPFRPIERAAAVLAQPGAKGETSTAPYLGPYPCESVRNAASADCSYIVY